MSIPISLAHDYFLSLQDRITKQLSQTDGKPFKKDQWKRDEGGGGISRYLEQGALFERAAVLFSHVKGSSLPASATAQRQNLRGRPWEAMGVSLVLHPTNPYIPTTHLNVRLFIAHSSKETQAPVFWFGGGMDLTPYYPFVDDIRHFHQTCHDALKPFGDDYYPKYKTWCDEYFYVRHRDEMRGVGGIFYDDLNTPNFEHCFNLTRSVGDHFLKAYIPIVEKRRHLTFTERERDFQAYRRGRYVEFNLVLDRGTTFGLQSGGRTESILLSLPPVAKWRYQWHPEPDSPEAKLYQYLKPQEWL